MVITIVLFVSFSRLDFFFKNLAFLMAKLEIKQQKHSTKMRKFEGL